MARACALLWLAVTLFAAARLSAEAPPHRYEVESGSVRDNRTRLTWQQAVDAETRAWDDAVAYCAQLGLAGRKWRAPTLKELLTLVDPARTAAPVIDISVFPDTPTSIFWSANEWATDPAYAWTVDFRMGNSAKDHAKSTRAHVRCVR